MLHRAAVLHKDDLVGRHFRIREPALAANTRKRRCKSKVIRLAPILRRMMVALCTLNAYAKKRLRHGFNIVRRSSHASVPDRGWIEPLTARRRENLGDELIIWFIRRDRIAYPSGKQRGTGSLFGCSVARAAVLQDVGPFQRKIAGIFGPFEQSIDQSSALIAAF